MGTWEMVGCTPTTDPSSRIAAPWSLHFAGGEAHGVQLRLEITIIIGAIQGRSTPCTLPETNIAPKNGGFQ